VVSGRVSHRAASRALAAEEGVSGADARNYYSFFAEESNLNLLSVNEVRDISAQVSGFMFEVSSVSLLGWPSNILLTGRRLDSSV